MSDKAPIYREGNWFVDSRFDKTVVVDTDSFHCFIFNFPLKDFDKHVSFKYGNFVLRGAFAMQFPDFRALCEEEGYTLPVVTKVALCNLKEYIDRERPEWSLRRVSDANMDEAVCVMQHVFDILYEA